MQLSQDAQTSLPDIMAFVPDSGDDVENSGSAPS